MSILSHRNFQTFKLIGLFFFILKYFPNDGGHTQRIAILASSS